MAKYDRAWLSNEQRNADLEELKETFFAHEGTYQSNYAPYLRCPLCKEARLTMVNAGAGFLRRCQGSSHGADCFYLLDEEHCKIEKEISSEANRQQIDAQVLAAVRYTYGKSDALMDYAKPISRLPYTNTVRKTREIVHRKKRFPQRNLASLLVEESYEYYTVFYGNVYVYMQEKKGNFFLHIKDQKNSPIKFTLKISSNVYKWFPCITKSGLKNEGFVHIAFLCKPEVRIIRGEKRYSGALIRSSYLRIGQE